SKRFEAEVRRDGKQYRIAFEHGEVVEPLDIVGKAPKGSRGSTVTFYPNHDIFKSIDGFEYARVRRRLRELSFLTGGVKIVLEDRRGAEVKREVFHEKGGVAAFAEALAKDAKPLYDKAIALAGTATVDTDRGPQTIDVQVGIVHTSGIGQTNLTYATLTTNRTIGPHCTG